MNLPHGLILLLGSVRHEPPPRLAPTLVLFGLLLGTLGLLAVWTLIRWSLRRAGGLERPVSRNAVPESAWSVAGKRAKPIEREPDESGGG
ncbi:MAG: hypothetical protein JNK58_07040 [Phycisphaerae bacterium]|nr:hypothetical protein [Phycisphaerae bacterium]